MGAQLTARLQSKSVSLRYRYAVGIRKNLTCALSAGLQSEGGIHDEDLTPGLYESIVQGLDFRVGPTFRLRGKSEDFALRAIVLYEL